ncbi:MAG TPA: hypothetical protein DEA44_06880 [Firmicutes bacterium]|nr:hypothetical protein [Bacillota bacterium]HWR56898.1 spore coat protein [Negativicutes bacterium]
MEHEISPCSMMDLALAQSKYTIQLLTRLAQECVHDNLREAAGSALSDSIETQQTLWQHLHAKNLYTVQEASAEEIAYSRRYITDLYLARESKD